MNNSENRNKSRTESLDIRKDYPISFMVLSFFALVLYTFVIILMLRNKKLRRKPANNFLLNILIADGIVCIAFISFAGEVFERWRAERNFYENYFKLETFNIFVDVAVVLSMLHFTLITVDRLIAVKWPFFYMDRIHTKESFIAIAVLWVITIVYTIVRIILSNVLDSQTSKYVGKITSGVLVTAGFMTLIMSNSFVFVEARRHLRKLEKISRNVENISAESSDKSSNKERNFRKKEFRLVKINIGLILCFFLFWINFLIVSIKLLIHNGEMEPPLPMNYILASLYLLHMYYICNPLWYVTLSYDVKREVKKVYRKVEEFSTCSPMT